MRRRFLLALLAACSSHGPATSPTSDAGRDSGSPHPGDASSGGRDAADARSSPPSDGSPGADSNGPASIAGLRLFYSDLVSGPNSGGQNDKGAFVTLYGKGFGATRGASTVTIGGGSADNYPLWTDTKITAQLGGAAATGNLVVQVAGKGASNGLPFTVRPGAIYFVSASGSDSATGSFAAPWATIPMAKNTIAAGDIAYIGTSASDSVSQTTVDPSSSYGCALGMSYNDGTNQGTATAPKALVVYPGAQATIGDPTTNDGIKVPGISGTFDYWVIAGFILRGQPEALNLEGPSNGWRIVGNDISCPNGTGETGCVTGGSSSLAFYGNVVHDAAASVTTITKYYHAVYFSGDGLDLGWNTVENGKTCRAIQFHDTDGPNEYDLHVHDNLIHDTVCDGINFATVDPSQGTVEAYNNVIYNVGLGPDPADGSSDYAGVYVAGETDHGSTGSGTVLVYNNTLYNCGSRANSSSGAFSNSGVNANLTMKLVNNLVYAIGSDVYVASDTPSGMIVGSNNLWFGAGAAPSNETASVVSNPTLANAAMLDFHLLAGSPAIGAGIVTTALFDYDGTARGSSFDIGAYEHTN